MVVTDAQPQWSVYSSNHIVQVSTPYPSYVWKTTDRHFETLKFKKKSELFFDDTLAELSAKSKASYVLLWLDDEGME